MTLSAGLALVLVGCGGGETNDPPDPSQGARDAGQYLEFLNPQYSLAAGDYIVVAGTVNTGEAGNYTLEIETDAGTQSFSGSWANSGGTDPASSDNPRHAFTLAQPGGATITLDATIDSHVILLDRREQVLHQTAEPDGNNSILDLPRSQIDSIAYAEAYYATIDPDNDKDTLAKWKTANGFGSGTGVEYDVSFRDTKDLGYGRHMRARRNDDGSIAFVVDNYAVSTIPGFSYGPLNLQALIARDRQHIVATNAIEFSAGPGGGAMFTKFFNFEKPDGDGVQSRKLTVDLDGRGEKAMPGMCIVCHGGKTLPLNPDTGLMVDGGDVKSSLHPFELETFEFSNTASFTREEQEAALKAMNLLALEAYPQEGDTDFINGDGLWSGDGARAIVHAMYGGETTPLDYIDDHVPDGWITDPGDPNSPPAGADVLYREVVGPHCSVCHSKRGTTLQDIEDFSTYDNFIQYADLTQYYVFDAGSMPASRLNFEAFWGTPEKADLLASFLPGFSRLDTDGAVLKPGRPIADPGPDRRAHLPLEMAGENSLFADSYLWQITGQPAGGNASFSASAEALSSTEAQPTLYGDVDGDYTLQLVVSNSAGQTSDAADVTVIYDSTMEAQSDITLAYVRTNVLDNCILCHQVGGNSQTLLDDGMVSIGMEGIPIAWDASDDQVYADLLQRINFRDPERSRILLKPSNYGQPDIEGTLSDNLHRGGVRGGFDVNNLDPANTDEGYHILLNWILEGAVK
ncbi:MAG: hypothetical protein AAF434_02145 [Pseudomonadota bacterium]